MILILMLPLSLKAMNIKIKVKKEVIYLGSSGVEPTLIADNGYFPPHLFCDAVVK